MKECKRCLINETVPGVKFDSKGHCNYCNLHNKLENDYKLLSFDSVAHKIRHEGENKEYDCIVGISGGVDSSYMLYSAVKIHKLRPLVIHFDNDWNSVEAKNNMFNLLKNLNLRSIVFRPDIEEYDNLCKAFLEASVTEADIPNDIAMTKLIMDTARKYNIKYVLNGHNFRTEGSCPLGWTYMDGMYIQSVYHNHMDKRLVNYPNLGFIDQVKYGLVGIKQVRPYYYMNMNTEACLNTLKDIMPWSDYGGKHCENIYTEFVGSYLLPKKFGINKSILYLSALVRSNYLSRDDAAKKYALPPVFSEIKLQKIKDRLKISDVKFKEIMDAPKNTFKDFNTYHGLFKRYRLLIKLASKLKIVPETFYIKYTKDV